MNKLKTLFSSNIPIDCHILKGRLEREGLNCFVFDENIVWVNPFKAVAIGGVKLKVPSDQFELAEKILEQIKKGNLFDKNGEYEIASILNLEFEKQTEILRIKSDIRKNPALLIKPIKIKSTILSRNDIGLIIDSEKDFQTLTNKKFKFTWKDFFYELLDFDGDVFKYLKPRPVEYYLDKEIVDNYTSKSTSDAAVICPNCKSNNTKNGYAIDYKWDILYLILSLLIATPFPLFRKKTHCFDCGYDFKRQKAAANNG
ncbi:DUF2007 domain-containing protein [Carboxylicivirga sp. A043]|uniref:putative signal transducing protein n=1 Tax=Carboxylicivirga litoralis TaxID=2816963 RepID=UPI0021CB6EB3|nr:DUF2007 domain-containing protein [Carboxylicivirga sp. A043]MCU4154574.1 DUF2007 domain-containing protein [Carboxylicivirga sp. A043]